MGMIKVFYVLGESSRTPVPRFRIPWFLFFLGAGLCSAGEQEFKIKYLASDMVYLDQGKDAGLALGDILFVMEGTEKKAELKVTYLSNLSAACTVVKQYSELAAGDTVIMARKAETSVGKEKPLVEKTSDPPPAKEISSSGRAGTTRVKKGRSKISGTLSLQHFQYLDASDRGSDFTQPGLRLNIKGHGLLGGGYGFRIKTRTRYNQRERPVNSNLPETEWKNRIYEASFRYEDENARFNYRIGRIISNRFSGVGYIDGGLLQANLSERNEVGLFVGNQPEWQHSDLRTSLKKYGAYYHFHHGSYQSKHMFESTLAWAAEYHGSTVNREFAYIRNRYNLGRRLLLFQSAEIEINRDWRLEKTDKSLVLTNLHAYGRYQLTEKVRVGLSYDDRQNYYTYDLRNRDEAYFDAYSRQGFQADVQVRLTGSMNFNAHYGLRRQEGDGQEDTSSYYINFYKRNFPVKSWSLNLKANGFSNEYTEGFNPSLRLGKRFSAAGHTIYLGYSHYDYDFVLTDTRRRTQWFRLETYLVLSRRFFFSGQFEYNDGDDAEGYRIFVELGYRL